MAEISSSGSSEGRAPAKDPRAIARKYQLELCKEAVANNTIVCLGTGCGKTHIAVLVMYELGHLFRKPKKDVCVFLAPTVLLVRQQAVVIEDSTDFKVQTYHGDTKHLKNHENWENEVQQYEVLVMTPEVFLQSLRHCFLRMGLVALLVFDECHHAQRDMMHPYSLIMKEFYKTNDGWCPHIFGMTASPIIGRGGPNELEYAKCINSLENILHAKVRGVEHSEELDGIVACPDVRVYLYGPVNVNSSKIISLFFEELEVRKSRLEALLKSRIDDLELEKKLSLLRKVHDNLTFCLENLGVFGALKVAHILSLNDGIKLIKSKHSTTNTCETKQYLKEAISVLSCKFSNGDLDFSDTLEEPFYSKKLLALIMILQKYRERENVRCIVFVKRKLVAKSLALILENIFPDTWKCKFLVGFCSGSITRCMMDDIVEDFRSGKVNLLIATNVAEEGLDIPACCLVIRFDLPETVASFIQSRGRARMSKSEYAFLVERGNLDEENLINEFRWSEDVMNKQIIERTSKEIFDLREEATFRVESTGASISTGCSVQLLHHYCSKLPHDQYFTPSPKVFYIDDPSGTICRIILPSNSPIRHVESFPSTSKDEAKRAACLNACVELHALGALNDHLLPESGCDIEKPSAETSNILDDEDDNRKEIHEIIIADALKASWSTLENQVTLHLYYIKFVPIPEDREYRKFGVLVRVSLPKEVEMMEVDLHLAHHRIVKATLVPSGTVTFTAEEIILAQKFQEMFLKIILDRSEFSHDFIPLGLSKPPILDSTFYLLLPICLKQHSLNRGIDWETLRTCLSSPAFSEQDDSFGRGFSVCDPSESLILAHGPVRKRDVVNSLVFSSCNNIFYFVDEIFYGSCANDKMRKSHLSYAEYYKNKHNIALLYPEQPLLKAKQLFSPRNLLHNRLHENIEARELDEKFVELLPELCQLKIIGFSKDIGSSLSLLPSFMHRLENLLVAIQLKDVLSSSFPECSGISALRILEALTLEKCLERFSLERLEILGDAFLKYVVGRHSFLSFEALDEGQLTRNRSSIVNNSNLYELAIMKKLQVYIRDEFEPTNFFALGRPCRVICDYDTELYSHSKRGEIGDDEDSSFMKCSKGHRWLYKKSIADAVEALVGAFLVDCGFNAAIAFLKWIGIAVSYEVSDVHRIIEESKFNMSLIDEIDISAIEKKLDYHFLHKGLLLQAFIHPSYTRHRGGCYQRMEFLGDAVLEYLITSYLYSSYPELKPGLLTDLKAVVLSNGSFAHIAARQSFHTYLISDSECLTKAINIFARHAVVDDESDLVDEPKYPKVLGDIIESCIGAVLLDSGFDLKCVWRVMLVLLKPDLVGLSNIPMNPIRELYELCQSCGFGHKFLKPVKQKDVFSVEVVVDTKDRKLSRVATDHNSKAARKFASQRLLSELKGLGFKRNSLKDVLVTTKKEVPELIGFDEKPVAVYGDVHDSIQLDKLQLNSEESSVHYPMISRHSPVPFGHHKHNLSLPKRSAPCQVGISDNPRISKQKAVVGHVSDTNALDYWSDDQKTEGSAVNVNAKSRLFEICAVNFWSPPSFECCKEEGPSHSKMFTYKVKVIMKVQGSPSTIVECFSESRKKKKAAQEHAAEGALWYLKHLGYIQA